MISSTMRKHALGLSVLIAISALTGCGKIDIKSQFLGQVAKPTPLAQVNKPAPEVRKGSSVTVNFTSAGPETLSGSIVCGKMPIRSGRIVATNSQGIIATMGFIVDGRYEIRNLPRGHCSLMLVLDPEGAMPFPIPGLTADFPQGNHPQHRLPVPMLPGRLSELKNFDIEDFENIEMYQRLHEIYGNSDSPLSIHIHAGLNQFDIMLELPEIDMPKIEVPEIEVPEIEVPEIG